MMPSTNQPLTRRSFLALGASLSLAGCARRAPAAGTAPMQIETGVTNETIRLGRWPTYRGDANRSGHVAAAGPGADAVVAWRTPLAAETDPSVLTPVVDESGVYVPVTAGRYLGVFDASGDRTERIDGKSADISTPTVESERVAFADGFRAVGVERRNWTQSWVQRLDGRGTTPTIVGDTAIVPTSAGSGSAHAFDVRNGSVSWQRQTGVVVQPAGADGSVVVLCEGAGKLRALDVADGTTRWEASTERGTITTAPVLGAYVYVGSATQDGSAGHLEAYDANTGERAWKRSFDRSYVAGTPAVSPETHRLYCTTASGVVRALDQRTGDDVGRTELPTPDRKTPVDTSPVIAGRFLYVTDPTGAIRAYALSSDEGGDHLQLQWVAEFDQRIQSSPVVSSSALLALSSSAVVALSPA